MAEYIDRERVIQEIKDMDNCGCITRSVNHVCENMRGIPTADVIERSTMEILCNEYLSKCNCCDECCAETYCILNSLRTEDRNCVNNLITYFTERNIGE